MKRRRLSLTMLVLMFFAHVSFAEMVNITFRVEMKEISVASGLYLGSDWAGWEFSKFQQLTDENNDSIYEITIPMLPGGSYNFRYTLGNTSWDNFEDLSLTTCGFGPKKQDRHIIVPQTDSVLNIVCFGSCTDCASTPKTYLNLSVDMRGDTISPNGIYVAGSFNAWGANASKMQDDNLDSIYEISIVVPPGRTYEYKFLNGNTWGTEELIFGTCEFRSNRIATVVNESITIPLVKFGYCDAAGTPVSGKKIACIGNSITHGYGTSDMFTKCWPFQLRDSLGAGYYAENLGVSGRTMLKTGDQPWWNEPQYNYTFELQPEIVVIKLGTNDSKSFNWNATNYKADYIDLINKLREMPTHPEIYMVTPAKAYSTAYAISDVTIKNNIIPILNQIAFEKGVNLIDMYNATLKMPANFPDGVHPNDKGAAAIAKKVKENLLHEKPEITKLDVMPDTSSSSLYQWFCNDEPISGSGKRSISTSKSGIYKIAVKASIASNDVYVSDPFTLETDKEVYLTTNMNVLTGAKSSKTDEVLVFPNPASKILYIENASQKDLRLINSEGKIILEQKIKSNLEQINTSNIKSGLYLLNISDNKDKVTKNVIIK